MKNVNISKKCHCQNPEKSLKEIDLLFAKLNKDKSLPTFAEFFLHCMILGIAERVNLKTLYPKTYIKLTKFLNKHQQKIIEHNKKCS